MAEVTERRTLVVLFSVLVLDLLAFTCILPLFPALIDFYAVEPHRDSLYSNCENALKSFRAFIGAPDVSRLNSVFFGGLLGSLFSALQFVSSPLMGALSDIFGRKSVLIVSVVGSLMAYVLWSSAATFTIFVVSRIVGGLSKASVSVAIAVIADVCPTERRGKGMALIGVAFSVAFLVGPMIGAWFAKRARTNELFLSTPALFAIVLTIIELVCIVLFLPETLPKEKRKTKVADVISGWHSYVSPKSLFNFSPVEKSMDSQSLSAVQSYGKIYFLYLFLYSGLEFTLTFFTHIRFNYDSMQQGRMYFFTGLLMVIIQGGFVRRIPTVKHRWAAQIGLGVIIPSFIVIGLANDHFVFYVGLALYAIASAIVVPCLTTVVSELASEGDKGAVLGVFRSLGALARALGPLVSSAMFWFVGPTTCYILGGLLLFVPFVMLQKQQRFLNQKSD